MTFSIGAVARIAGVTVKTLRHYERLALLMPRRTRAGHRRYSPDDLGRLERIRALRSLGFPLRTLKTLTKDPAVAVRAQREALERQRACLDRAIDALARIEEDPDAAVAIDRFVGDAAWDRWEILRAARASSARRAPDRADPSRLALFREIATAIDDDPEDLRAANLAASWRDTVEPETLESWRDRARWPSGMRRWVASLYEATPESWERVAAFIEAH